MAGALVPAGAVGGGVLPGGSTQAVKQERINRASGRGSCMGDIVCVEIGENTIVQFRYSFLMRFGETRLILPWVAKAGLQEVKAKK